MARPLPISPVLILLVGLALPCTLSAEPSPVGAGAATPACEEIPVPSAWAPAEVWTWQQVCAGKEADLSVFAKVQMASPSVQAAAGERPKLSPRFLHALLTEAPYRPVTAAHGLRVSHAQITDTLDLSGQTIPASIRFSRVELMGDLCLNAVLLESPLEILSSTISGDLVLNGATAERHVTIRDSTLQDLEVVQFTVGTLAVVGATISGEMSADGLLVQGTADLQTTVFSGKVDLDLARFAGPLILNGAAFKGFLGGDSLRADLILAVNTIFGADVHLNLAEIAGSLLLTGAVFCGDVAAQGVQVGGNFLASDAEFRGQVVLAAARVTGVLELARTSVAGHLMASALTASHIYAVGARLNTLDLTGASIAHSLVLDQADFLSNPSFQGTLGLGGATLGALLANGARFAHIKANFVKVGTNVVLGEKALVRQGIIAILARIGGQFQAEGDFGSINLYGAELASGAVLSNSRIRGDFNMSGTTSAGGIVVQDSRFWGDIFMSTVAFAGHFTAVNSRFYADVNMRGTRFSSVRFENTRGRYSFNGDRLETEFCIQFRNARFDEFIGLVMSRSTCIAVEGPDRRINLSGISLYGAEVTGDLTLRRLEVSDKVHLERIHVGGDIEIDDALFQSQIDLDQSTTRGCIRVSDSHLWSTLAAPESSLSVTDASAGCLFVQNSWLDGLNMQRTRVGAYARYRNVHFESAFEAGGAHVQGPVSFSGVEFFNSVNWGQGQFDGPVEFEHVDIWGGLELSGARLAGGLEMKLVDVSDRALLEAVDVRPWIHIVDGHFHQGLSLIGAQIAIELTIKGGSFADHADGSGDDRAGLDLMLARGGLVEIRSSQLGRTRLATVVTRKATFDGIFLHGVMVDQRLFGAMMTIRGPFTVSDSDFRGPLIFFGSEIDYVSLRSTVFRLRDTGPDDGETNITAAVSARAGHFGMFMLECVDLDSIDLTHAVIKNRLGMHWSTVHDHFRASLIRVNGVLGLYRSDLRGKVSLSRAQVSDVLTFWKSFVFDHVDLSDSVVGAELALSGGEFADDVDLSASRTGTLALANADGAVSRWHPGANLNLTNARIDVLRDRADAWDGLEGALVLTGWSVDRVEGGGWGTPIGDPPAGHRPVDQAFSAPSLADRSVGQLQAFLQKQAGFDKLALKGVTETLAVMVSTSGFPEKAKELRIWGEEHEQNLAWKNKSWFEQVSSLAARLISYGHDVTPAVTVLFVLVLIGAAAHLYLTLPTIKCKLAEEDEEKASAQVLVGAGHCPDCVTVQPPSPQASPTSGEGVRETTACAAGDPPGRDGSERIPDCEHRGPEFARPDRLLATAWVWLGALAHSFWFSVDMSLPLLVDLNQKHEDELQHFGIGWQTWYYAQKLFSFLLMVLIVAGLTGLVKSG